MAFKCVIPDNYTQAYVLDFSYRLKNWMRDNLTDGFRDVKLSYVYESKECIATFPNDEDGVYFQLKMLDPAVIPTMGKKAW